MQHAKHEFDGNYSVASALRWSRAVQHCSCMAELQGMASTAAAAAPMDRKALLRARFATLAAEVDTTASPQPARTTSDFIAEAMARAATQPALDHPALSINDAVSSVAVVASATPQRSRNGMDGAPARAADWAALGDALEAVRRHSDFEACLQDPSFAEAEDLRSVIEAFASLPWSSDAAPQQQAESNTKVATAAAAAAAVPSPSLGRGRRGALGDISNGGMSGHGLTPVKAATIVRKAKLGIPRMLKSSRVRGGRSRASAAPTRGGSDPNLEDELVSTVLTDPRTNVGVSSMKCIEGTTFYGVDVIGPEQQWTVYRRYRQFEALQASLTALGKQRNPPPEAENGPPSREADAAALLAKLLPQKTFLKANDLELAYRRVMLDAYVREVWRSDEERIESALREFLKPGGAQAAAGYNSPKTGQTAGWLRVGRCADYSDLPTAEALPRRWVCVDGGSKTDRQIRTEPTIWYSRRPGCNTTTGVIRSISLRDAILNPDPSLRQQRAFELTTPRERVLFVAGSSAEWVHWLSVIMPLLSSRLASTFQGISLGPAGEEIVVKPSALVPDHTRKRSGSFSDFSYGRPGHAVVAAAAAPVERRTAVFRKKVRKTIDPLIEDVGELQLGDWAVGPASRAVKLCPGDASSWAARGDALAKLGRRGAARADFEAALILKPNFTPARRALATIRAPDTDEPPAPSFAYLKPMKSSTSPVDPEAIGTQLTPNTRAKARRTLSLSPEASMTMATSDEENENSPPGTPGSVAESLLSELCATPPNLDREGPRLPPHSVGLGGTVRRVGRSRSRQLQVESEAVVVVDTGSACLRAGFAGEGAPRVVANMHGGYQVGRGSSLCPTSLAEEKLTAGGTADAVASGAFSAEQQNFAVEWDGLVETWEALFEQQLLIDSADHSFVMSTLPDMTPASRSTMLETMFEHFEAPCLRTESPSVLSLHASGLRDGLVIDCGNRLSVTPIVEGYVLEQAAHRSFYGGLALTAELRRRLMDSGVDAAGLGQGNNEAVRMLKERYCRVAPFGHAAADSLVSFNATERRRCVVGPPGVAGGPSSASNPLLFLSLSLSLSLSVHMARSESKASLGY